MAGMGRIGRDLIGRPQIRVICWTWLGLPNPSPSPNSDSMTTLTNRSVSSACVPVSTTASRLANRETEQVLVGTNRAHLNHLIGVLVHSYGWTLGQDGNLYSPNPAETAWGERAA